MSMFNAMKDRYQSYRATARERKQYQSAYMAISELPQHILKDIGWPAAYERQRLYR